MTYRNDHEAALARVDALEQELARVRAEATTPKPAESPVPHRSPRPWLLAACVGALLAGTCTGVALGTGEQRDRAPSAAPVVHTIDRTSLAACAREIQPRPALDARATDPRGAHLSVEPVGQTAAPCRDELHEILVREPLSPEEREALWQWAVHEDELAGTISRILVYYSRDPYALDNYASAQQLWVEYDRAYASRNHAVAAWRDRFARDGDTPR